MQSRAEGPTLTGALEVILVAVVSRSHFATVTATLARSQTTTAAATVPIASPPTVAHRHRTMTIIARRHTAPCSPSPC